MSTFAGRKEVVDDEAVEIPQRAVEIYESPRRAVKILETPRGAVKIFETPRGAPGEDNKPFVVDESSLSEFINPVLQEAIPEVPEDKEAGSEENKGELVNAPVPPATLDDEDYYGAAFCILLIVFGVYLIITKIVSLINQLQ
ncbi:hypothetical protein LSTR_LSTR011488 [Laodelphax striatellus]|uniref:Uncharacterized protein n=1 Tax=Laodelphax striatellus TaxID=195883 RepID=A0A482WG77_LAOST|nr:hypothetical protein LSTR_LSTR011488 [Laodelphax striatellus]